ncbi:acetyltransferase domain-containing protein [Xylariaceae sp. FL0016]|nr:acetyltransferase domain-containing protein [Xylariaceae sp. FL0016]
MEEMPPLATALSEIRRLSLGLAELESLGVVPWFSYTVNLPKRPLPFISDRPHLKTERLVLRPILPSDLEAFFELRQNPETQNQSKTRGRPDKTKEETKAAIDTLNHDVQNHWYFGIFLQSTGEMIGEDGMPDCITMSTSNSGWPEAEFLIKPKHFGQGYGTEAFKAIVESWWNLPREKRRHQIIGALVPGKDPGDEVQEGLVFQWEEHNTRAAKFFAKMLAQAPASAEGTFTSRDTREGREGDIVRWAGTIATNPRSPPV